MLKEFRCDLHIHTCLSPCGDLNMYPSAIVNTAIDKCLDIIAITDHNASENVQYVMKAAMGKPLIVLPGIEITSSEEVHLLALFDDLSNLIQMQNIIYHSLFGKNKEDIFGYQAIVNEFDQVEGFNEKLLIGSTELSLRDLVDKIHRFNGLAIPAHIDREGFGLINQLGFVPADAHFDALEVSCKSSIKEVCQKYPDLPEYPLTTSSDAHFIDDIGSCFMRFYIEKPTIPELKMALNRQIGRYIKE